MLLLCLGLGLAGMSERVMAQTPEPDGMWTFENGENRMEAAKGNMTMTPAVMGAQSISPATVSEAEIVAAPGPTGEYTAISLPAGSALKVARAEGAEASQSYTLMMDIMLPNASDWNSLFQTDESNSNDGDLFTHENQIGIASMGGYFGNIREDKWYRVVLSYRNGKNVLYVNGTKLVEANPDNGDRFKIGAWGFYLFADESGERVETCVNEVRFWEAPLTDEQVAELGSTVPPVPNEVMEIATPEDLYNFAQLIQGGAELDGVLTADIDLRETDYSNMMIGTQAYPFTGVFDGKGHTVTYSYDFSANYCGLFSYISGATIKNLRVEGDVVTRGIHYGALIGYGDGEMLVENVVTNVEITGEHSGVTGNGGMIGALYGNITFNNCATLGKMGYPGSSMYCGFVAFATSGVLSTLNNCYTTCELTEDTGLDYCHTFCRGDCQLNNCYALNQLVTNEVQGAAIDEEQIESGSLCYKLNGDQSNIAWTQSIGTDPFPMPDPNGPRVYGSGTLRCDGTEIEDSPLTYTNTEAYPVIPDHQFGLDGICSVCGTPDPNAVQQDAEGYYLISNADQMYWLNLKVQQSDAQIKVRLTDNIDLNDCVDPSLMIGTEGRPFTGIFDGGYHTIHYDYDEVTQKWRGLFAFVKDATICNLRVEGSAYVTQIHYGALIGRGNGTILVENVVTDVDIIGAMNQVTGDAGMIGANYANLTFNNCATLGEMGFEGSSMYSPFSGWSEANSSTTLNNCYSTCTLTEGTGTGNCFTLTHQNGTVTINNSYYLNAIGKVLTGNNIHQAQITEEQLASGELCHLLNGDQSNIGWYQTLGEDNMPVPDPNHLKVYGAGQVFMNITDEASFKEFVAIVIEDETQRLENTIVQKSLVDTYLEDLNGLKTAADIDAFMAGFAALDGQRQAIQSCADAYAAYIAKVEYAKNYLDENPDLDNLKVDFLRSYLEELDEPGEDYPNGSAVYILDNCLLSEEEIIAETARIDEMLVAAITFTPAVGTDVSMLFTNIDLSDQFNGWEGQVPTGWGTSETSPLYAAECLAAKMDMYQTVTGLPNGIYELQINGAFRPTPYNDFYNVNYAATLYANGIHNFFQANIEDMISVDDAIDGVNCNINGPVADFPIVDEDDNVIGYTMQGIVSCCNAFQAGRYPNYVLCHVTDGQLTIGVRQPGTSLTRDWLGFGNIKVTYYGEIDDAEESLDRVLASQSARAKTILDVYEKTIDINDAYAAYPNYSQALKNELRQTLDAVAGTRDSDVKYQLIEKFSELFLKIYECKQAYIHLMDMAEEVSSMEMAFADLLTDEKFEELENLYSMLIGGYVDGTMSAEEINAINLTDYLDFFPDEEDGYYLLRNLEDYTFFAAMVNGGSTKINAKLLADIDLNEGDNPDLMIGTSDAQFGGIFDGQGHTVNYSYEVNDNYCGLFRYADGATIRNLRVTGDAIVTTIHFGALVGWASNNVLVESVITDVDIIGDHSGVTGDGGMFGRMEGDATFNNCATLGSMGNPGSSMYCGFVAYSGSGTSVLNNCFTACELTEGTGTDYCYTFCRGNVRLNNCYYLNPVGAAQGTQMTLDQFRSGEVCYKLNGNQSNIRWYQTINEDTYPVLSADRYQVFFNSEENIYYNLVNGIPVGIGEIAESNQLTADGGQGIYNLAGQRLSKMQKGINIINGKKILVK